MGRTKSPGLRVTSLHCFSCDDQAGCPAWHWQCWVAPGIVALPQQNSTMCSCFGITRLEFCRSLHKFPFKFLTKGLWKDIWRKTCCMARLLLTWTPMLHLLEYKVSSQLQLAWADAWVCLHLPALFSFIIWKIFKLKIGIRFLRSDTSCWADNGTCGQLCVGSAGAAGV